MMTNKYINFRKTNSVDFAAQFPWFSVWLSKNAESIDIASKKAVLKKGRDREIPMFPELGGVTEWHEGLEPKCGEIIRIGNEYYRCKIDTDEKPLGYIFTKDDERITDKDGGILFDGELSEFFEQTSIAEISSNLAITYFLDDIRVVYFRGVPYESPLDFLTSAEYADVEDFTVDSERHVLLVPARNYKDTKTDFQIVTEVHQDHSQINVVHKEISRIKIGKLNNVYLSDSGLRENDTLGEAFSKINDSLVWEDLEDNPSVFTTKDGDRLTYCDGWYALTN